MLKCLTAGAALACPAGRTLAVEAPVGVDVSAEGYFISDIALKACLRLPATGVFDNTVGYSTVDTIGYVADAETVSAKCSWVEA